MVIDCVPFFNELDILKLRLEILNPIVDKFVIEEARYTFSGQPKELCFEKNKDMFSEFLHKIDYIVVDELNEKLNTHERDKFQKNHLIKGLVDANDNDVIIIGDVDEIPNPKVLKKLIDTFDCDKVYHLAQRLFYCFLNMEEVSGKLLSITGDFEEKKRIPEGKTAEDGVFEHPMWLGTKVLAKKNIPETGIIDVRELSTEDDNAVRVPNGGWHFGYMGSKHETDVSKRIGVKVVAAAHQEYNTEDILKEARDRLLLGQDMFGRDSHFERAEIDESYPDYLREHMKDYDYLIMPKVSAVGKVLIKIKLKVFRFFRRCKRYIKRHLGK